MVSKIMMAVVGLVLAAGVFISVEGARGRAAAFRGRDTFAGDRSWGCESGERAGGEKIGRCWRSVRPRGTPLVQAILQDRPAMVQNCCCVRAAMPIGNYFADGRPLHFAAKDGDPRLVALLLEHRAKVSAVTSGGESPLMITAWSIGDAQHQLKCRRIVEMLVKAGADVEAKDNNGRTALMLAVESDNVAVVRALIRQREPICSREMPRA